uniref:hypothetical protein n=1 Tax=Bartonella bovis TaxID=155194 RepID=UPI00130481EC
EEVKVKINDGGMVRLLGDVTFNNGTEAGIQIKGDRDGKAIVMGMGKTVTMTVKGTRGGIEMQGSGKIDATVMGLTIKREGSGGDGGGCAEWDDDFDWGRGVGVYSGGECEEWDGGYKWEVED